MHAISRFNVRVYGLLLNPFNQILVADEVFKNGIKATKFPGGGLEFGEGTKECLQRELKEETGIAITHLQHFYTTDFFQPSFLDTESQIISVYYTCRSADWQQIKTSTVKYDFEVTAGLEAESFRWVPLTDLASETDIILPIDRVVVGLMMERL